MGSQEMKGSTLAAVIIMLTMSCQVVTAAVWVTFLADDFHDYFVADSVVHDPIVITSDGDFASQGWPGSGTPENPYVIEGLSIEGAYLESCIEVVDTRVHFIVSNCFLYGVEGYFSAGLYLNNVTNGLIEHNNCTQNDDAILLRRCQNNTLRSNRCFINNRKGIYLANSDNNTLTDNDCSNDNAHGIYMFQSNKVNILNNTSNQNYDAGIYVSGGIDSYSRDFIIANNTCNGVSGDGICLYRTVSGVVANNTCSDNEYGLYILSSMSLTVTKNTFFENSYGISLSHSSDISVTWNTLDNTGYNARDGTELNFFDYNYWSDYAGSDDDGDGIGDTPYDEPLHNIVDNHPLMYPPGSQPTTTATTTATTTTTATFGMSFEAAILLALGTVGSLVIVVLFFIWIRKPANHVIDGRLLIY